MSKHGNLTKCEKCGDEIIGTKYYYKWGVVMKLLKIVGVTIGILMFLILAIGCADSGETNEKSTETSKEIEKTGSESNKTTEKKYYELTDKMFKNKDFILTLGEIEPNYTEEYMSLKEGFRVVRIPISIKNLSTSDMFTESFKAKVNNKMVEEYFGADDWIIAEEILSETTKDGAIYYEVPNDSKELILVYNYGVWTDKKVEFKLNIALK